MTDNETIKKNIIKRSEHLFLRYGFRSVTMDDIARELGMSKKTLYQHFENKTEIIEQMSALHFLEEKAAIARIHTEATDAIDEMLQIARHVIYEVSKMSATAIFDMQKYYRHIWESWDVFKQDFVLKQIKSNIERGITEGIYRSDVSPDIIARLYISKSDCVVDEQNFPHEQFPKSHLFRTYIIYHLRGIVSPKGAALLDERLQYLDLQLIAR
jgi:TetR/AcrR family transcriptional regulator, cholesterol catabolism regulator